MRYYTALLAPGRAPVLLREGFSWGAFFFGPFWLLAHRAWIPGAVALLVFALAGGVRGAAVPLWGVLAVAAGVFGRDLVRWSWEQRGYHLAHVLAARNGEAALARLLAARTDLAGFYADLPPP